MGISAAFGASGGGFAAPVRVGIIEAGEGGGCSFDGDEGVSNELKDAVLF